jgi:hypothetical protein
MRLLSPFAAVLLTAFPAFGQAAKYDKAETEALQKIQAAWIEAATKAASGKHEVLLMRSIDEARIAGAGADTLRDEESALMVARAYAPRQDGAEAAGILAASRTAAGAAVQSLLALDPPAASLARFAEHLARALEVDPKNAKALALYQKRTAAALAGKDWNVLRTLVMRAAELDPAGYKAGKYSGAEQALAGNGGLVVRGRDHLLQATVVLPDGWTAKKTWPMFVSIVGANCAYDSMLDELKRKAAKKPFILVVAKTIANANELEFAKLPYPKSVMERYGDLQRRPQRVDWDEIGLLSVLAEIRQRFAAQERFFMTGYSGGAFLVHHWLQHRSEQLLGACAGSGNYSSTAEQGAVKPADGGCPVLIVSGSRDQAGPPRIFPQSDQAAKALKDLGFTQVDRRHLENRDHEAFYELGLELLEKITAKKK